MAGAEEANQVTALVELPDVPVIASLPVTRRSRISGDGTCAYGAGSVALVVDQPSQRTVDASAEVSSGYL